MVEFCLSLSLSTQFYFLLFFPSDSACASLFSFFNFFFIFLSILDLIGSNVRVCLSASEILKLADKIISKSKQVHDAIASVPIDKVSTNFGYNQRNNPWILSIFFFPYALRRFSFPDNEWKLSIVFHF